MYLFEDEIGWMENFEEKMERKTFWSVFGWVGREENKWWGPSVFSSGPQKFSLQNGEKIEGRKCGCLMGKNAYL